MRPVNTTSNLPTVLRSRFERTMQWEGPFLLFLRFITMSTVMESWTQTSSRPHVNHSVFHGTLGDGWGRRRLIWRMSIRSVSICDDWMGSRVNI